MAESSFLDTLEKASTNIDVDLQSGISRTLMGPWNKHYLKLFFFLVSPDDGECESGFGFALSVFELFCKCQIHILPTVQNDERVILPCVCVCVYVYVCVLTFIRSSCDVFVFV